MYSIVSIICEQVPELLDADRCSLFFIDKEKQQLVVSKTASRGRRKTLVSWLFGSSAAPDLPFEEGKSELRLPLDKGIAGHVAQTGEALNIGMLCYSCHLQWPSMSS
jgi:GAF domain-containing protein